MSCTVELVLEFGGGVFISRSTQRGFLFLSSVHVKCHKYMLWIIWLTLSWFYLFVFNICPSD